ncbi:unnamed protein product [Protopolystoma xenopodis]|uniref:Uncharacterized protein n=1 Tax=Protopolystoma xenopodis TaxID=117903 RepID=A0A3S5B817_9PLAT|nr:unnamed protein product [Protopolystoma xenopodis]
MAEAFMFLGQTGSTISENTNNLATKGQFGQCWGLRRYLYQLLSESVPINGKAVAVSTRRAQTTPVPSQV